VTYTLHSIADRCLHAQCSIYQIIAL